MLSLTAVLPISSGPVADLNLPSQTLEDPMTSNFGKVAAIAAIAAFGVVAMAAQAEARDQIRIVGSSTVFPYTQAAAEEFSKASGMKAPVVERSEEHTSELQSLLRISYAG